MSDDELIIDAFANLRDRRDKEALIEALRSRSVGNPKLAADMVEQALVRRSIHVTADGNVQLGSD